jgi:TldD protein
MTSERRTKPAVLAGLAACLLLATAAARLAGAQQAAGGAADVVVRALSDEMARSMARLRLESFEPPYRIAYVVPETESFTVDASFGAILRTREGHHRGLSADVRVGDYSLDNSNFSGGLGSFFTFGGGGGFFPGGNSLPEKDDYAAIRHRVWLATDAAYKSALETLARKKAWLESNTVTDRPDDLSPSGPPVDRLEPRAALAVNRERWETVARELSAIFRKYPDVQESRVEFEASARNRLLVTSEGSRTRRGETLWRLDVSASTQAEDGMALGDAISFRGRAEGDLPPLEGMRAQVEDLARGLSARVRARKAEEYIGPVLFEGEAAGEFLLQLLIDRLANPVEPLGSRGGGGTPFKNRLHKRVLPAFLTVVDDPLVASWKGAPLLGAFAIDDDGVPAQKVVLVEEGRLLSWYMSRVPTREIKETNGHSRGGAGDAGCVFVTSANTVPAAKLREELIRNARDQELTHAVRVEAIGRTDLRVRGARAGMARPGGGSETSLGAPVRAYWVSVEDGSEEPMRGGEFQAVSLRTLRDILVTDDRPVVLNTTRRGHPVSIVTPSLLVEEMEIKKPADEQIKTPYLKHPSFDKP